MGMKARSSSISLTRSGAMRIGLATARSLWCRKQGLGPRASGDALHVVTRTGWVRTLAGVDVYLAVRARSPEVTRAAMDQQVAEGALRVSPAARGCIYLVPSAHRSLALAHAHALMRSRTERELDKAGVTPAEVERLARTVHHLLIDRGPCTTAEIRAGLPAGAVRSLGARGKRVGMSSPLPVALRELEFDGRIERQLEAGRLDSDRYRWCAIPAERNTLGRGFDDVTVRASNLTRLFLEVAGPATAREIASWTGLSMANTLQALDGLDTEAVDIVDQDSAQVRHAEILGGDIDDLADADAGADAPAEFSFLPFEDNLLTVHGGPAVHADSRFFDWPVQSWGGARATTLGQARHVGQRSLLLGNELVGFWEFDPDAGEVVSATFRPLAARLQKILAREREALAQFIRDELGHARSFSLDTDDAVRKRASALRALA